MSRISEVDTQLERIDEKVSLFDYLTRIYEILKDNTGYLVLIGCIAVIVLSKVLIINLVMVMCDEDMVILTEQVNDIDTILLALGHQWDSIHFVNIATNWYPSGVENDILFAFGPLYPYLISLIGNYVENYYIAGILVSNTFYFMSLISFYFVSRQYMDKIHAYLSTTLFAVFPTYLVYGTVAYTEPVALFFAISSWFFFKKEKYHLASILITLTILTRYAFILVVPVYGMIMFARKSRSVKQDDPRRNLIEWRVLWLLIPTISVVVLFKYFESLTGNFFVVLHSHAFFADSLRTPVDQFDWFFTGFFTEVNEFNPILLLLERYIFTIPFTILILSLLKDKKELGFYGIVLMWLTMSMVGISGIASPRIMLSSWVAFLAFGKNASYSMYIVMIGLSIVSGLWVMFHFLTGFFA